ncbi:pilus assembly protein PilP [Aquirhabdus parva]|uniref:Pilus assembly protein PilP n=2 Tax=Aquirhabdus parva TaxID=2283318 RepID=A0A345PB31_9GAMM|nr:pilus assembly protein PilP [Aquirhabdus parva]
MTENKSSQWQIRSKNAPKILIFGGVLLVGMLSTGCSSRVDGVAMEMQKIHNEPTLPITPAPVFLPVPTFTYAAQGFRSPFIALSLAEEMKVMAGRHVMPDLSRPLQFLEQFPLENLRMRGTIHNQKGPLYGLIEDPQGGVLRVQVGNYLGKNYGRIVGITPTQVNLVEIVPDGKDGFVERPRSLIMVDAGG